MTSFLLPAVWVRICGSCGHLDLLKVASFYSASSRSEEEHLYNQPIPSLRPTVRPPLQFLTTSVTACSAYFWPCLGCTILTWLHPQASSRSLKYECRLTVSVVWGKNYVDLSLYRTESLCEYLNYLGWQIIKKMPSRWIITKYYNLPIRLILLSSSESFTIIMNHNSISIYRVML